MVALRKSATRKANRFSKPRLRLHRNKYYSAFKAGPANEARYARARRRWHLLMFHDAPLNSMQREFYTDPALSLMKRGYSDVEVVDALAQGVGDRRSMSIFNSSSSRISPGILRRFPVKVSPNLVMTPPSPAIQPAGRSAEHLRFVLPRSVLVCVRRKQRREVLLALGKGGSRHKRPEWSEESYIRC